jgi:hypothetical protein
MSKPVTLTWHRVSGDRAGTMPRAQSAPFGAGRVDRQLRSDRQGHVQVEPWLLLKDEDHTA